MWPSCDIRGTTCIFLVLSVFTCPAAAPCWPSYWLITSSNRDSRPGFAHGDQWGLGQSRQMSTGAGMYYLQLHLFLDDFNHVPGRAVQTVSLARVKASHWPKSKKKHVATIHWLSFGTYCAFTKKELNDGSGIVGCCSTSKPASVTGLSHSSHPCSTLQWHPGSREIQSPSAPSA